MAQTQTAYFDTVSRSPYLLNPQSQVWYCDTDSIEERIEWIDTEKIAGVGFWALTYEEGVLSLIHI